MTTIEIVQRRWHTTLAVTLPGDAAAPNVRLAERILITELNRLEKAASRFRADSEISVVNRAVGRWSSSGRATAHTVGQWSGMGQAA